MTKMTSSSTTAESPTTTTHRKMSLRPKIVKAKKPKTVTAKKKLSKLEADKPKKPPTAFFYFLEDFRKEFQQENPEVKSMREVFTIGKAGGEKWKIMTFEEKVQYYDVATAQRANFEKALADYAKKKENREHDEFEEDPEYDE